MCLPLPQQEHKAALAQWKKAGALNDGNTDPATPLKAQGMVTIVDVSDAALPDGSMDDVWMDPRHKVMQLGPDASGKLLQQLIGGV